jgi:exodeoxyribonuclease V alpha subunit
MTSSLENLSGLVERVAFHNPDNGFCVLRVQVKGKKELVTVIGKHQRLPPVNLSKQLDNGFMTVTMDYNLKLNF